MEGLGRTVPYYLVVRHDRPETVYIRAFPDAAECPKVSKVYGKRSLSPPPPYLATFPVPSREYRL